MKKRWVLLALGGCLGAAFFSPFSAQAGFTRNSSFSSLCQSTQFQLCGFSFPVPAGNLGDTFSFTLPEKFVINTVSVQCVGDGVSPYYKIINGDAANCAVKTCKPAEMTVCDASVPVRAETPFGEKTEVEVPRQMIDEAAQASPLTFSAACVSKDGAVRYEIVDAFKISCSAFLCKPATLKACDSEIVIAKPEAMGTSFSTITYNNKPVTISCLGTEGRAPRFVVTDHACD